MGDNQNVNMNEITQIFYLVRLFVFVFSFSTMNVRYLATLIEHNSIDCQLHWSKQTANTTTIHSFNARPIFFWLGEVEKFQQFRRVKIHCEKQYSLHHRNWFNLLEFLCFIFCTEFGKIIVVFNWIFWIKQQIRHSFLKNKAKATTVTKR